MNISVVIPTFNSAATLPALVEALEPVLADVASAYEIIFVVDGCRDNTWQVVSELSGRHATIRGLNMMRNYGQHNALLCGIRAARYEVVITLDDDLQNPPAEIPKLVARLNEGYDVVYGTPAKQQHGLWRNMASQVTKLVLQSGMGADTARNISAFRIFRTQVREAFANYNSPFVCLDVLLTWGTSRFSAVHVRHDLRAAGTSNYTFRKLVTHAINMLTGFSVMPLQLASMNGFLFMILGMVALAYVLIPNLVSGVAVPGFPFLASIIIIFSGAQLFALGIIGEYLARMYARSMDRPAYLVKEQTAGNSLSSEQALSPAGRSATPEALVGLKSK